MKRITLMVNDVQESTLLEVLMNAQNGYGTPYKNIAVTEILDQVQDSRRDVTPITSDTYLLAQVNLYDGMREGGTYEDCCKRAKRVVDKFMELNSMEVK